MNEGGSSRCRRKPTNSAQPEAVALPVNEKRSLLDALSLPLDKDIRIRGDRIVRSFVCISVLAGLLTLICLLLSYRLLLLMIN